MKILYVIFENIHKLQALCSYYTWTSGLVYLNGKSSCFTPYTWNKLLCLRKHTEKTNKSWVSDVYFSKSALKYIRES